MIQLEIQVHTSGIGGSGEQEMRVWVGGENLQPDVPDADLRAMAETLPYETLCGPLYGPGATITITYLGLTGLRRDIPVEAP